MLVVRQDLIYIGKWYLKVINLSLSFPSETKDSVGKERERGLCYLNIIIHCPLLAIVEHLVICCFGWIVVIVTLIRKDINLL